MPNCHQWSRSAATQPNQGQGHHFLVGPLTALVDIRLSDGAGPSRQATSRFERVWEPLADQYDLLRGSGPTHNGTRTRSGRS